MPLTNSLYVPGKLSDPDHVIVDVGTGYYVKKVRRTHLVVLQSLSLSNSIYLSKSDPRTSTKTLFNQSGLHPDELGNIGGYDTKETRKYELSGQYFTEQDTNADTGRSPAAGLIRKLKKMIFRLPLLFLVAIVIAFLHLGETIWATCMVDSIHLRISDSFLANLLFSNQGLN